MPAMMRPWLLAAALAAAGNVHAIEAHRLAAGETIVLDGRLDDGAWSKARPNDRFYEYFPRDRIDAMVRTEVRIAYDREAIYVGVRAHDPDPAKLRAPFARRDNVLSDQDMIQVTIDPAGARKFAHIFRVNPNGSVGDGLFNEDSQNEDFSPDLEFDVVTGPFEGGWTAEFRIPFSSLRYGEPPAREWSLLVIRTYPRDQRYRFATAPFPRDNTCFLCLAEPLTGLADIAPARHLALTPNGTVRTVQRRSDRQATTRESEAVPSLDIKWRPRADVVIDATVNPDFSQVELDTPQLAGNAQFALFFPEKRPFFLEGADILQSPFNAIYTRSVTDPSWGVRATQRGGGFDATALVTRDGGGGLVLLPNTYGTGFAPQDFKSLATFARARWQSGSLTVGGLATDRTLEDRRGYNRVAGPDVVWFPTTQHRLRTQLLGSWTSAQPGPGGSLAKGEVRESHAAMADWGYEGPQWGEYLNLEDVGRGFRADNGFFGQSGYRRIYSETRRKWVNAFGFNDITAYVNAEHKRTLDAGVQYQQNNFGVRLGLPRNTTIVLEARPNNLIATRPGGGVLKRDQAYFAIESTPFAWSPRLFYEIAYGDRLDVANNRIGKGSYQSFQASLRPHVRAEVEYRVDNDVIDSRQRSQRIILQRIQQLLAIWHFSARDSVRTIVQSVSVQRTPALWEFSVPRREDNQTVSVVYGHRRGIAAAFYLGASLTRSRIPDAGVDARQAEVFAKASWTFDVF
jgi:hypothetical protein